MKKMAIIGAGSMAEALLTGIIESKLLTGSQIWVTNKQDEKKLSQLHERYGVNISYDLQEILQHADVVMLAMEPKDVAAAIGQIKPYLHENMLMISVLAGVSINSIQRLAGKSIGIVRAMPNTSAAIGKSATALAANVMVTYTQKEVVRSIFETVGLVTFVKEEQLDAVTGLSGSGPAYIYYLVEAMEKSAVEIGLEQQMAKDFIIQTLLGAAEMLTKTAKPSVQLRKEVTSPGGTTEAGINVLEAHGVQHAFINCIKEATAQSQRLGHALTTEISAKEKTS